MCQELHNAVKCQEMSGKWKCCELSGIVKCCEISGTVLNCHEIRNDVILKLLGPRECPRGQKPATLQCLNHSENFHRALHCFLSFGPLLPETAIVGFPKAI